MKETKLLRRTMSLFLALVMLLSFPVGAYSEGTGSDPEEAPEIPEGYVWRTLSVELAPFEEDCLEEEEEEAARMAEKTAEATRFMELLLSRDAAVAEEEDDSEPVIAVRGWMPEDITAQAELISYADADLYAELAMMQVELRFYDGEGQLWTPATPVMVFVDGDAVRDARAGQMDPTVYVYREDVEKEELRKQTRRADASEEERLFSVQAFSAARTGDQEKTYELEEEELYADVVERALSKDDEYPDALCFETASESLCFAITARQQDRSYSAATEDGETEIVVVGTLPCGLSAQVAQTAAEAEALDLPGELVRSWDLSLTHPEAADYQIDGTVKVALRDAALAEMQNEDWELQLWQLRENDEPIRVKSAAFRGEDLRFSADNLSSYAVVRVALERCLTASDGETYSVRVNYDSYAGIPVGAELQVREIFPEDIIYAKYLSKSADCAGQRLADLDFARMFDISLRDPETGVEYQPNQNVKVSIELLSEDVNESTLVDVVHFGQQTEVMGSVVSGEVVAFETKGFSVYVLMGVTLEKTITAADGNSYAISVTYGKGAGIPAGAELKVRELDGEEYQQYLEKTADFLLCSTEELDRTRFFDITIEKDGVVYEPNEAVSVSVNLIDRPASRGEVRVVHFADEGTELLENELTADGVVEFQTNSFSVYAITDEQGEVIVPRALYTFLYSDGREVPDGNNGTQYILNNGTLNEVVPDDNAGLYFMGWYIWDNSTGWGDKVEFDTPISVAIGDVGGATGTSVIVPRSTDLENPILFQEVKVKARYTDNFATVKFMKASYPTQVYMSEMVPIPEGQASATYVVPDGSDAEHTLEATDNEYSFYAWSTQWLNSTSAYYSPRDSRQKTSSITITRGRTCELYPMFKQGNWVFFNTSPVGAGASNVAPVFVTMNNKVNQPENPTWRGRLFLYWTTTPTFDKETGVVYQSKYSDQDNYIPAPDPYDFNRIVKDAIPDGQKSLELYAHWEPDMSSYTVIVWKQSVQDDRDFSDSQKTYEFDSQYVIDWPTDRKVTLADASASLGIDLTNLESDPATRANFAGFQHKVNQDPATGGYVDTVEATVRDNGSTVLNVYYDRKMVYFKFYNTNGSKPSFNHSYYTTQPAATNKTAFWYYGLYGQDIGKYGYSWPKDRAWYFFHDDTSVSGELMQEILPYFVLFDSVKDPNEPPVGDPAKAYYEETEIRLYSSTTSNLVRFYYYVQQPDGTYLSNPNQTPYVGTVLLSGSATVRFDEIFEGYVCYGYQVIGTATGATGRTYSPTGWRTDFKNADGSYKRIPVYKGNVLHVAYERRKYTISYFDALDGKPLATPIQDGSGTSVKVVDDVLFKEDIAKYYPDPSFAPESQVNGWRFNGRWYSDKECRVQIFLGETDETKLWYYRDESGEKIYTDRVVTQAEIDAHPERSYGKEESECFTEMPNRNLALYAGFSKIWYWVKIDPNGGAFNNNDPSNINAKTYDKVEYDAVINGEWYKTISRNFVEDRAGTWYYHYDEFNMDDPTGTQPATRKAYYAEDPSVSTDGGKKYRPVASEEEGYEFGGWYKLEKNDNLAGQKLVQYNFADHITENITLQAMWKKKGTYYVYYLLEPVDQNGEPVDGLTITGVAPTDEFRYASDSTIPVLPSSLKATDSEGVEYEIAGWFFDIEVVAPGGVHKANRALAEQHPEMDKDNPRRPYNTFIFRPYFKVADLPDNDANTTRLILDANGGRKNDRYGTLPEGAAYTDDGTQLHFNQKLLNMSVQLPVVLPGGQGEDNANVFVKDNSEFIGWAFNKSARVPALYPKQIVGINNQDGSGYNVNEKINILYAVWRKSDVTVSIKLKDYFSDEPVRGGKFIMTNENGSQIIGIEDTLISNDNGELAKNGVVAFKLKTPTDPDKPAVYMLTEIAAARGYIPLSAPVQITVDYYGYFDVKYDLDDDELSDFDKESLNVSGTNDKYLITIFQRPAICQINDGGVKKLFGTLNDAMDYAEDMKDQTATIEMLKHYVVPENDVVEVDDCKITFTTASRADFLEDDDVAILTREKSYEYSLFTVSDGSLILHNLILDGAGTTATGMTDGGLIAVEDDGKLTVGKGTILRNSTSNKKGGAIYLEAEAEADIADCEITGNKAAEGAGIYVSAGAKLSISGNINFGGSSITAGNFSTQAISSGKNATQDYPYGRQDIYLVEDDDAPTTLYVTGELTGGAGTIWVWAESAKHYAMNKDFAQVTKPDVLTEATMHAFRNAREDAVTGCGSAYLTGQQGSQKDWIAWTGGVDVNFKKIDGFGEKLGGAKFTLFTDLACTEFVMNQGERVTATSDENGVVTFAAVSSGIYYMMETMAPDGYHENTNKYILLVGKDYVTVPTDANNLTGAWANALRGITQEQIEDQRRGYKEVFNNTELYGDVYYRDETNYVIFRLDENDHYTTVPDIARKGIVNFSTVERPVILSKVNPVLMPLAEGEFKLRSIDGSEIKNDNLLDSDDSGVFFAGVLSVGTYLLEETEAPRNLKNLAESYTKPDYYFVFQVTEGGVMALKRDQNNEEVFARTNTVIVATSDEYKISDNP